MEETEQNARVLHDKAILCGITNLILKPTEYSQI
jgi:hypothetical protein